jgi:outer membrane lipoprotein SlyB
MKKYIPFLVIIALISMIMGCVSSLENVKKTVYENAPTFGAMGVGAVGAGIGYAVGGKGGAMAGGLIGAALGAALGYTLTKQDEKNIEKVLEKRPNKEYSWCSGSKRVVKGNIGSCSANSQKIMMTARKTQAVQGKSKCRNIQIEVLDSNGKEKTITQKLCQSNDGKWHSA